MTLENPNENNSITGQENPIRNEYNVHNNLDQNPKTPIYNVFIDLNKSKIIY
jgi:hypothetical protein